MTWMKRPFKASARPDATSATSVAIRSAEYQADAGCDERLGEEGVFKVAIVKVRAALRTREECLRRWDIIHLVHDAPLDPLRAVLALRRRGRVDGIEVGYQDRHGHQKEDKDRFPVLRVSQEEPEGSQDRRTSSHRSEYQEEGREDPRGD